MQGVPRRGKGPKGAHEGRPYGAPDPTRALTRAALPTPVGGVLLACEEVDEGVEVGCGDGVGEVDGHEAVFVALGDGGAGVDDGTHG